MDAIDSYSDNELRQAAISPPRSGLHQLIETLTCIYFYLTAVIQLKMI